MNPESIGTGVPTQTLGEHLRTRGLTRRSLLQYAACTASLMGLSPREAAAMAQGLEKATRQSVIWLSFQECTGCTESLTRSFSPSLEDLIFDFISLDYHHTLQAVSGEAAEAARHAAMKAHAGKYIVVVDGSVPLGEGGIYSVIAGMTNAAMLAETVEHAAAVIAVGTCAAHGGLPEARPNPTGAVAISQLVKGRTVVNIPGCPPMPQAMAGTLTHFLSLARCRSWMRWAGRRPSSAKPSTTAATAARSTTAASLPRPSTTRARAAAGACTSWAARAR